MFVTFIIIFAIINSFFEFKLLQQLKAKHPEILIREGNPKFYWNNTNKMSFFLGYIGLKQYKADNLDKETIKWCKYNFCLTWFGVVIYCYGVFWLINRALYV